MIPISLRALFVGLTSLFWLSIGYYAFVAPPAGVGSPPSGSSQGAPLPLLTDAEVARHHSATDCWIVIDRVVYDLSRYVPEHPAKHRELEARCGGDGTEPWEAKESGRDRGESHSDKAKKLLAGFPRVGVVGR